MIMWSDGRVYYYIEQYIAKVPYSNLNVRKLAAIAIKPAHAAVTVIKNSSTIYLQ